MKFNRLLPVMGGALLLSMALPYRSAQAFTFDWDTSQWDHSAFGGGTSSGWAGGYLGGSATEGGVTMTVELERFGAGNTHSNLLSNDPNVAFLWDNEVETYHHASRDGVLAIGSVNDLNPGSQLNNFTKVTLKFSQSVQLSSLMFGDVDASKNREWQDLLFVSASNNGNAAGIDYTLSTFNGDKVQQELYSAFGLDGVQGVYNGKNGSDARFSTEYANVGVGINGFVNEVSVFYTQGSDMVALNQADTHGIWLDDVSYTAATKPAPEPTTILGSIALVIGGAWYRKKKGSMV